MLDDLYFTDNLRAAQDAALRPPPAQKVAPSLSVWGAVRAAPRGVVAGGAQSIGFASDVMGAFGGISVASGMGDPLLADRAEVTKEQERIQREGLNFSSEPGDDLRGFARFLAPDPETAHTAERLVFDFARIATKAVGYSVAAGNPVAGAVLTGGDEGMSTADDLKQQGVDLGTRSAVGAVVGAATGLGVALPVAGSTLRQTAGLVAVGGPLSFMAQQQAARSILESQDYGKLAEQYDPLDPVGLAVSTLIPAGFGAWSLRSVRSRVAAEAKAAEAQAKQEFAAGPRPSEETPVARAVREVTEEQVDAARVWQLGEQRRTANPFKADDWRAYDQHEAALSRAMDQIAAGQRVSVDDLLPTPRVSLEALAAVRELGDLQVERETLLPLAGDLAEPGAIRAARQELRLMEQDRPDVSEAGARALAKQIQAQQEVSYKTALADAKKQLQAQLEDFQARQQRLQQAIDNNARAQQAAQRLGEIDQRLQALEAQAGADAVLPRFAQRLTSAGRAIEAELPKPAFKPQETLRAAEPVAQKPAGAEQAPAAPAAPARATEPAAGSDGARPASSTAKAGLVEDAAAAARVEQVKAMAPDLLVQLDGMEKPMRVDELLDSVKAEADDLLADGELMRQAAECALSVGA